MAQATHRYPTIRPQGLDERDYHLPGQPPSVPQNAPKTVVSVPVVATGMKRHAEDIPGDDQTPTKRQKIDNGHSQSQGPGAIDLSDDEIEIL
jgi:hypothetical protein